MVYTANREKVEIVTSRNMRGHYAMLKHHDAQYEIIDMAFVAWYKYKTMGFG